jgi:hypothetical protein
MTITPIELPQEKHTSCCGKQIVTEQMGGDSVERRAQAHHCMAEVLAGRLLLRLNNASGRQQLVCRVALRHYEGAQPVLTDPSIVNQTLSSL